MAVGVIPLGKHGARELDTPPMHRLRHQPQHQRETKRERN